MLYEFLISVVRTACITHHILALVAYNRKSLFQIHRNLFSGRQTHLFDFIVISVALGGLVVSVLATGPKVRGFKPDGF
jgi:hypothetical protein